MRNGHLQMMMTIGISLLMVAGCWPPGDDDDDTVTPTPSEGTPTPEPETPTPIPGPVTISGTVIPVDRDTGEAIDPSVAAQWIGSTVVYIVRDPEDLVHVVNKSTMDEPGFYSVEVDPNSGVYYVIAVVDVDENRVITSHDLLREAVKSPVTAYADDHENVDIYIDLPFLTWMAGGGDGGGGGDDGYDTTDFSGVVLYDADNEANTEIAVIGFASDYSDDIFGITTRQGSGEYALTLTNYASYTAIIGYADADRNGLFEPNDDAGFAIDNPYALDGVGVDNADILIEGLISDGLPAPIPYVGVSGTVAVEEGYGGTPIFLSLDNSATGITYDELVLTEPGNFNLRVPGNLSDLVLSAVTDSNGNGVLEPGVDASDTYGPFALGTSNLGGITLTLTYEETGETGFAGTVYYNGGITASSSDRLVIAAFISRAEDAEPVLLQYQDPIFPAEYEVTGLEDLLDTYGQDELSLYIGAVLDVGSNMGGAPADGDIAGVYTLDGINENTIVVRRNQITLGIDIALGNYAE